MSARPRLEIQFDERLPAYRSGWELAGKVVVDCHNNNGLLHVARFFVECLGYSEVQESATGTQRKLRRDHLVLTQSLLPPNQTLESRRFEFKFRLPPSVPHSVECEGVGFVRYCCRAVVCLDSAGADTVEAVGYFSLIEEVDLNSPIVQLRCRPAEQASASATERVPGRSGKEGEVKASLVLPKSGYVPGENVECTLNVHCGAAGGALVQRVSMNLVQEVTAIGDNGQPMCSCRQAIAQEQVQADEQYSEQFWSARCHLHIPGAVATSLKGERCQHPIAVQYTVEMVIELALTASSPPAMELRLSCPVVIGTVPLQETAKALNPIVAEPSFADTYRCVISDGNHSRERNATAARSSSFIGQLIPMGHRRKPSCRSTPPTPYTLYCIYYPTISILRRQKNPKSILKRHSVDNSLDAANPSRDQEEQLLHVTQRTASISWIETPL